MKGTGRGGCREGHAEKGWDLGRKELEDLAHLCPASFSPRSQRMRAGGKESLKAEEEFSQTTLCSHHPQ